MGRTALAICIAFLVFPLLATADVINVTAPGAQATITAAMGGDFLIEYATNQPTGSGTILPFLRVKQAGNHNYEQGYNTSLAFPYDDQPSHTFTHELLFSALPIVTLSGVDYFQFLLDINQTSNGPVSLNQVQIFQTHSDQASTGLTAATATTPPVIQFGAGTREAFRINDASSPFHEIQAGAGSGSGSGDMFMYVPTADFVTGYSNIILYSQFGHPPGSLDADSGYEEWSIERASPNLVPEPGAWLLLATAGGIWLTVRRKRA